MTHRASSACILSRDMIMLGTSFEEPAGYWTKPTSIHDINPGEVHGHILLSSDDRLVAFEYREGPPNDIAHTDPTFFQELIEYFPKNAVASILGLQVLYKGPSKQTVEIVLKDVGTVMLGASDAQYGDHSLKPFLGFVFMENVPPKLCYHLCFIAK